MTIDPTAYFTITTGNSRRPSSPVDFGAPAYLGAQHPGYQGGYRNHLSSFPESDSEYISFQNPSSKEVASIGSNGRDYVGEAVNYIKNLLGFNNTEKVDVAYARNVGGKNEQSGSTAGFLANVGNSSPVAQTATAMG